MKKTFEGLSIGKIVDYLVRCVGMLNCRLMSLPFHYLGLSVGANPRKKETWNPIIKKFEKKLSLWKNKVLSFSGRICLIKLILSCLSLYYLSFFKVPCVIEKKLKKIQ